MSSRPGFVAIVGPTASGKTALSLEVARRFNGEIISADSRQIYRGMDIGTAKPTYAERRAIPHHLINIKNPDEEYTVAEYKRDAVAAINNILRRGKMPILVGGTGLYVRAIVDNLDIPPVKADPALRKKLEIEIEKEGLEAAFQRLVALDPEATYIVDPKNPRRVVRALEVALTTGEPFTSQRKKSEPLFDVLEVGMDISPATLRARIDARVDQMIANGFVEEVKQLIDRCGADLSAFNAIGYQEIIEYVKGGRSLEEAVAAIKLATWHYGKRQLTWFKKDQRIHWMKASEEALQLIKKEGASA